MSPRFRFPQGGELALGGGLIGSLGATAFATHKPPLVATVAGSLFPLVFVWVLSICFYRAPNRRS